MPLHEKIDKRFAKDYADKLGGVQTVYAEHDNAFEAGNNALMLFSDTHSEKKKGKGEDDIEGHIADNDAVLHGQGADNAGNADNSQGVEKV